MTTTSNLGIDHLVAGTTSPEPIVNQQADMLDAGIAGRLTKNLTADADYTLAAASGSTPAEWSYPDITVTDTGAVLTAGRSIIMPSGKGIVWRVENQTAQSLTFKVSGGTGVAVAAAAEAFLYYDGTDIAEMQTGGGISTDSGIPEAYDQVAISAGAATVDFAVGQVFDITLDQDITSLTLTGTTADKACAVTLILRQDATGGRTITWPASVSWPDGSEVQPASAANSVTLISLLTVDDGANWLGFGGSGGGMSLPVDDTTPLVRDPTDNTKQVGIDAGAVGAGQHRRLVMPDYDVDLGSLNLTKDTTTAAEAVSGTALTGAMIAAGALVEWGSNANGEYWRWESGLQVCAGSGTGTTSVASSNKFGTTAGTVYQADVVVTLPAAMVSTDYKPTADAVPRGLVTLSGFSRTTADFVVQVVNNTSGSSVDFVWIAVGRWK